jgi:hypothetical protein
MRKRIKVAVLVRSTDKKTNGLIVQRTKRRIKRIEKLNRISRINRNNVVIRGNSIFLLTK